MPQLYDSGGIRRFSDLRVQAAIDAALAEAEDGDKVVVVAHHVYNDDGVALLNTTKMSVMVRLPAGFSVMAACFKDWSAGDVGAEAKIVWKP